MKKRIEKEIINFLKEEIVKDDISLEKEQELLYSGIIDSISIVKVVVFLERQFGVEFSYEELQPDHFSCISQMVNLVEKKLDKSGKR